METLELIFTLYAGLLGTLLLIVVKLLLSLNAKIDMHERFDKQRQRSDERFDKQQQRSDERFDTTLSAWRRCTRRSWPTAERPEPTASKYEATGRNSTPSATRPASNPKP